MTDQRAPVIVVRGSDPILVTDRLREVIDAVVGSEDRTLIVDEYPPESYDLGVIVDAAQTPPLFSAFRVIVARGASRFSKGEDVAPLVAYLADPLPSSSVVLVWEPVAGQARLATIPKKLNEAIALVNGEVISTDPGASRPARDEWWSTFFAQAAVQLDGRAQKRMRDSVGEDVAEAPGLMRLLSGAYGAGARLDVAAIEPFLGAGGSVPPWELTDAIDRGDTAGALDALHRMLDAGDRHPLQVMATLSSAYLRIATLQGASITSERDAAALLGIKGSTFPAKKALSTLRTLGPDGAKRAVSLCAQADLTLRGGGVSWPGKLVLEVLVARLSRLANTRTSRRG